MCCGSDGQNPGYNCMPFYATYPRHLINNNNNNNNNNNGDGFR
jgi:hypothetical protein